MPGPWQPVRTSPERTADSLPPASAGGRLALNNAPKPALAGFFLRCETPSTTSGTIIWNRKIGDGAIYSSLNHFNFLPPPSGAILLLRQGFGGQVAIHGCGMGMIH